jgi:glycine betaine/proline transport system ATP-binding protein
MVALDQWADKRPFELSGGMQQRVGLARAFATDADILLMDEPFSALDPLIRSHLQDELLDLQTRLQKTIVFVSHDLDEALKLGSRIAIMESGRVVQYGTPEDIVTRPANEYVRRFVANMNPLNVLRGEILMKPVEELEHGDGENGGSAVLLDSIGHYRCILNGGGRPSGVEVLGSSGRLLAYEPGMDFNAAGANDLVYGSLDTSMRDAIQIHHALGRPVPLLDGEGRLRGVVGASEIFKGLLRQIGSSPT